jgi:hypothetical protein
MIGDTKLIDLTSFAKPAVDGVRVFAKAEFLNPGFRFNPNKSSPHSTLSNPHPNILTLTLTLWP